MIDVKIKKELLEMLDETINAYPESFHQICSFVSGLCYAVKNAEKNNEDKNEDEVEDEESRKMLERIQEGRNEEGQEGQNG